MTDNNLRDWTVMVYFSADNDLQDEAFNNLSQMVEVGGSDKVHVLAQIDAREDIPTRRYFMRGPNDAVATDVNGETHAGNVKDLLEFVTWASDGEHRAHKYLIVLWGHANGIFDDEDDVGMATIKAEKEGKFDPDGHAGEKKPLSDRVRTALELAGIDNSFTSFELKEAFKDIEKILGKKVAILGMDACLMSMAEIAKQVSESVDLMVASEEVIPEKSWPYDRILEKLIEKTNVGSVTPEQLAKLMIDEYIERYQGADDPVTLSACRLHQMDVFAEALDEFGRSLTQLLDDEDLRRAVSKARRKSQMFLFREYVDLYDFCEQLVDTLKDKRFYPEGGQALSAKEAAIRSAETMRNAIGSNGGTESDFVLSSKNTSGKGGDLARAHGVSIYFPPLPPTYADLDLSRHTHWNNFVNGYLTTVFQPNKVIKPKRKQATRDSSSESLSESEERAYEQEAKAAKQAAPAIPDKPSTNGNKARLLLPKGTVIEDLAGKFVHELKAQAFLMMGEPAQIRVPEGTELDIPRKGSIKASSGTSVKASSGTSTKASSGTSTKASSGTSTKAIRRNLNGEVEVVCLDVPMCILNRSFSRQEPRLLKNGTKIYPPRPMGKQTPEDVEPIIIINEVKFVVDEPESEGEKAVKDKLFSYAVA